MSASSQPEKVISDLKPTKKLPVKKAVVKSKSKVAEPVVEATEDAKPEDAKHEDAKPEDAKPEFETFACECGAKVKPSGKTRHLKTKRHLTKTAKPSTD